MCVQEARERMVFILGGGYMNDFCSQ